MGFWDLVVRRKNIWPWDDDPLTSFSLRSFLKGFQKEKKKKKSTLMRKSIKSLPAVLLL